MRGGFLLVVVLVLVSGFIAYLGDVLGRRMGRRRVTLFGMRPRYTAIFISVVAGMLITLVTLIAVAAVSEDVRNGLLRARAMRQEIVKLEREVRANRNRVSEAQARTQRAETEWASSRTNLKAAKRETEAARTRLHDVSSTLKEVNAARARIVAQFAASQSLLRQVQARRDRTLAELKKKEDDLKKLNDQLENADALFAETGKANLKLEQEKAALEDRRSALTEEISALKTQSENLHQESVRLGAQVAKLQIFINTAKPVLTQEVVFEVGQELGRDVIDASLPVSTIKKRLEEFVRSVETSVRAAGAGESAGHAIILVKLMPIEGDTQPRLMEESHILDLLARDLHEQSGSSVVRCFSMLNVPRGQPVPVDFGFVPNKLLFTKGTELARITLDPSDSDLLLLQVIAWMRQDVATRAHEASILPDLSSPGERTLLFGTPQYSVGRISRERLSSLLKDVRKHRSPVEVVARAAKDTWTVGPLDIELAVAKVSRSKPKSTGLLQLWGTY